MPLGNLFASHKFSYINVIYDNSSNSSSITHTEFLAQLYESSSFKRIHLLLFCCNVRSTAAPPPDRAHNINEEKCRTVQHRDSSFYMPRARA
uniref:Uncharacterized protein n=1 Tax=Trichogramma kaykai TaxID=54128 RepID=A0ABD2XE51_9HYME